MSNYRDFLDYYRAYRATTPQGERESWGCGPLLMAVVVAAILLLLMQFL